MFRLVQAFVMACPAWKGMQCLYSYTVYGIEFRYCSTTAAHCWHDGDHCHCFCKQQKGNPRGVKPHRTRRK